MFKPIFSKLDAEVLMEDVIDGATDLERNAIKGFGADMYSKGLLKGSVVTLFFAMVPTAVYELNRLLREHP